MEEERNGREEGKSVNDNKATLCTMEAKEIFAI